jgi:hypothetical protein
MNNPQSADLSTRQDPGAMPSTLRFLNPTMTGQFLHEKRMKKNLFFKTDAGIPRSFTVLAAMGYKGSKEENLDLSRNGVVIIDNDNWRIVCDELLPQASGIRGTSRAQKRMLEAISAMEWSEFADFCTKQETYRAGAKDLDTKSAMPLGGSVPNQVKLGLYKIPKPEPKPIVEMRSDFLKELDAEGVYSFPPTDREGMIKDLLMRQSQLVGSKRYLSWDVGMRFNWDKSGHVEGGEDLNPKMDERWAREMDEKPEILEQACERAIEPYLAENFNVLEIGEEARCQLNLGGHNDKYVLLEEFGGRNMGFESFSDLRKSLTELDDDTLSNLWTTARVLDQDLSRASRAVEVSWALNAIRAEIEEEWAIGSEREISFAM